MELTVQEKSKNKLVLQLKSETTTICNVLRDQLWSDEKIKAAGYNVRHPLEGQPSLIIEITTKKPETALQDAVSSVRKDLSKLKKDIKKAK